ncbi:ABC transporter ATP-binding protein [Butyrivibrio sp. INlla16]|uniref:ABC transporter ATP-binding protein n=1 Tax=Butyrivibrio sp. INlla16 TaxID=1520807 RepID=UPI0008839C61|nr:ABC transporter ATP-binding protein [Butyrivibrio sp. INlla16]SDB02275.1 ATP-binding cassette, subfamily B [Butyrivibrio sp. INlla16]
MPKTNKLYEKIIPRFVPNSVVLALFSIIAFFSGPVKKRIRELHFRENSRLFSEHAERFLKNTGHIENQSEWTGVLFGTHKKSDMSYSGCEIIATYNALRSLGDKSDTIPYLIRYFEQKGIALKGGFGITPSAPCKFFRSRGFEVKKLTTRKKEDINSFGERYRTFIVTFYWNVNNIKDQLHTVNISKEADGFYIHNNYFRAKGGGYSRQGAYSSLAEAIDNLGANAVPLAIVCIRPSTAHIDRRTMKNTDERFTTKTSLVLYFLEGCKALFLSEVIFSIMVAFLDMVNPKIIQYTVDYLIGDSNSRMPFYMQMIVDFTGGKEYLRAHIAMMALIVVIIAFLCAVFRYLNKLLNSMAAEKLICRMRDILFEHISHLPFSWHSENHTGDIIQRCTSDVETIKNFLSEQLTALFRIVIMIGLGLTFMFQIDVKLSLISAAFIPVIVLYSLFFHNRIGSAFENADIEEGKLSAIAQENLTGVRVVRAFGREKFERERFEKKNTEYTNMWVHLMKLLAAFWTSNDLISGFQGMTVLVMGSVFCVQGRITVGELIAFVAYNAMISWPVRLLGRVISEMSKAGVSIDRLRYIMNSEVEKDDEDAGEPPLNKDIEFNHVSFTYENGTAEILKDVSFKVEAGKTVGVLGGTGSGKSTLMYLLDKLYNLPESGGSITIGGVDIRKIKMHYLRENIGFVLQEPFLFSRTLFENIGITSKSAKMEDVRKAAKMASLDDTIKNFDEGYDTFVGERGVTLSGGQKQRTAIAQMLITNPPIMIFDDSLSAVDTETDAKIRAALDKYAGMATTIIISHRITTLMHADQIIVLSHGKVVEEGTHDELLAENGLYRRIYDIQIQGGGEGIA